MSAKRANVILGIIGVVITIITWFGWNYGKFDFPFLYVLSVLLVIIGICRYVDADKPIADRRMGLKIFVFLLSLFGIAITILGVMGSNIFYILVGVLILVGGVVIFSNPYLIRKKS